MQRVVGSGRDNDAHYLAPCLLGNSGRVFCICVASKMSPASLVFLCVHVCKSSADLWGKRKYVIFVLGGRQEISLVV